jgi:hypothetical protein
MVKTLLSSLSIDCFDRLHHMVHFNTGKDTKDFVAMSKNQKTTRSIVTGMCLPFVSIQSSPEKSERYFVTGNERSVVNYYNEESGIKSAYHLNVGDKFSYLLELMNMNMEDQTVYITMTYDILDGPLPAGWTTTKALYLDANSCDTSEVQPPQQKGQFSIKSKPWTPNVEGKIVYAMVSISNKMLLNTANTRSVGSFARRRHCYRYASCTLPISLQISCGVLWIEGICLE